MKQKIVIEYPLENASESFLWKMIGEPLGLATWFSEEITVNDQEYTFYWDDQSQTAGLIGLEDKKLIRFQWNEDAETEYFFQFEIITDELSSNISLRITDFSHPDEHDDTRLLWDKHIDDLRKKAGI